MEAIIQKFSSSIELENRSIDDEPYHTASSVGMAAEEHGSSEAASDDAQDLKTNHSDPTWNKFETFMETQARRTPYPAYLYRAHTHGHPFPRVWDTMKHGYCDNFTSDSGARSEKIAKGDVHMYCADPDPNSPTVDVFEELRCHLQKTQIGLIDKSYSSRMVSLSGDFIWTTHRLCEVQKVSNDAQVPGLAIFETQCIQRAGSHIWRVDDMLEFLDMSAFTNAIEISPEVRRWASNADEYICWDFVPQEALLSFTLFRDLVKPSANVSGSFLAANFRNSSSLGNLRFRERVVIKPEDYIARLDAFLRTIAASFRCPAEKALPILRILVGYLVRGWDWGYKLSGLGEDIEEAMETYIVVLESEFTPNSSVP